MTNLAIRVGRTLPANWSILVPQLCYWCMWLFIVFVSVWDSFLTIVYRSDMRRVELNPIGRALIELNNGEVTYLLIAKGAGTILVASILAALYDYDPRKAYAITAPITCFQLWLLLFLSCC